MKKLQTTEETIAQEKKKKKDKANLKAAIKPATMKKLKEKTKHKKKHSHMKSDRKDFLQVVGEDLQKKSTDPQVNANEMENPPKSKLCKLVKADFLKYNLKDYQGLVMEPEYICCKCGRVAKEKTLLCSPQRIAK